MQTANNMSTNTSYIHVQYLQYQNSDTAFRSCYQLTTEHTETDSDEWMATVFVSYYSFWWDMHGNAGVWPSAQWPIWETVEIMKTFVNQKSIHTIHTHARTCAVCVCICVCVCVQCS